LEVAKAEGRICWNCQEEVYESRSKRYRHLRKKLYPFEYWGCNCMFETRDKKTVILQVLGYRKEGRITRENSDLLCTGRDEKI
jgi:hypothetical protein